MDDLHRMYGELPAEPDAMAISKGTPAPSSTTYASPLEPVPYTIDEAIADSIEQLTGEPFPDPFTGDHDIEYWIWAGDRLVPASPEAAERLLQQELLEQEEQRRWRERQQAARRRYLDTITYRVRSLLAPLQRLVDSWRGVEEETRENLASKLRVPERSKRSE
jgi:hypothetical protein